MGNTKKTSTSSRRSFFEKLLSAARKPEKIKLLTPDGKLVEVDKQIIEEASKKQKATNKDIYHWMENPSKENK